MTPVTQLKTLAQDVEKAYAPFYGPPHHRNAVMDSAKSLLEDALKVDSGPGRPGEQLQEAVNRVRASQEELELICRHTPRVEPYMNDQQRAEVLRFLVALGAFLLALQAHNAHPAFEPRLALADTNSVLIHTELVLMCVDGCAQEPLRFLSLRYSRVEDLRSCRPATEYKDFFPVKRARDFLETAEGGTGDWAKKSVRLRWGLSLALLHAFEPSTDVDRKATAPLNLGVITPRAGRRYLTVAI